MPAAGWREANRIWNGESVAVAAVPRLVTVDSRIFAKNKAADPICIVRWLILRAQHGQLLTVPLHGASRRMNQRHCLRSDQIFPQLLEETLFPLLAMRHSSAGILSPFRSAP